MYSYLNSETNTSSFDVRVSDLRTQKKDESLILNSLIRKFEEKGLLTWDDDKQSALKGFHKSMESSTTRSKLETKLIGYSSPIHNAQSLKMINMTYMDEQAATRSRRGVPDTYRR